MRRADRLFQLVQLIRGRRLSTAAWLAGRLEVSLRTLYRDVADLQAQGVPIEGEAGVGYRFGAGYELPPLMFSTEEAKALVAAVRIAGPRMDAALVAQAENALSKILAVLPSAARTAAEAQVLFVPAVGPDAVTLTRLAVLRQAAESRHLLRLLYRDQGGAPSERKVRPLGCFFWGAVWTLGAWCELRQDFRNFRLDRIVDAERLDDRFRDDAGRTLADFLRHSERSGWAAARAAGPVPPG
ncbi:MAG TPA: YafY family protein [Ideonella sp.]|uniref:helix-turn-helix transcriptional regulator n=1 Tax=Ideonella sp. TaxID=1929293 RepID=UPI002CA653F1|nr:YafY family protein [Ideonella sp.]HSI47826.1 YafY family protein [Ideonella sp.]